MATIILRAVSAFLGGFLIGLFAAQANTRGDYLKGQEPFAGGMAIVLLVVCVFLLVANVFAVHVNHMATSPSLGQHRSVVLMYGVLAIGGGVGLALFTWLFDLLIDVGQTTYPYDHPIQWDTGQWVAYVLPYAIAALLVVAGLVVAIVGAGWLRQVQAFLADLAGRSRGARRFNGQIVAAEASPDDRATRVVAEFLAPDGGRPVAAVVPGSQRSWLVGAKSAIWINQQQPYDPARIAFNARTFWRGQSFCATEAPPARPVQVPQPGQLR